MLASAGGKSCAASALFVSLAVGDRGRACVGARVCVCACGWLSSSCCAGDCGGRVCDAGGGWPVWPPGWPPSTASWCCGEVGEDGGDEGGANAGTGSGSGSAELLTARAAGTSNAWCCPCGACVPPVPVPPPEVFPVDSLRRRGCSGSAVVLAFFELLPPPSSEPNASALHVEQASV